MTPGERSVCAFARSLRGKSGQGDIPSVFVVAQEASKVESSSCRDFLGFHNLGTRVVA